MIRISKPYIKHFENKARLISNIYVDDNEPYEFYYEVEEEYSKYLVDELSDSFA